MKRLIFTLAILMFANLAFAQVRFDLLPRNVYKVLGHTDRTSFEAIVGEPVGEENGCIVYEVESAYDNMVTAIRCTYKNDTLVAITFGTAYYSAYWLGMVILKSPHKTQRTFRENEYGQRTAIYSWNGKFGCNILGIKQGSERSTAIINYFLK